MAPGDGLQEMDKNGIDMFSRDWNLEVGFDFLPGARELRYD